MPRSISRKQVQLATQAYELMFAAPQVVAHRTTRMMLGQPRASDRRDFRRMGPEKAEAGAEMWNDIAMQVARSGQDAVASYLQAWCKAAMNFYFPWLTGAGQARFPAWGMTPSQWQHATLDVMGKGMAPLHRRTVANAKRLRKF